MKKVLTALVLISSCLISKAQIYYSSCAPSDSIELIYRNDACKLAIQRLRETGSAFIDNITIPGDLIEGKPHELELRQFTRC